MDVSLPDAFETPELGAHMNNGNGVADTENTKTGGAPGNAPFVRVDGMC